MYYIFMLDGPVLLLNFLQGFLDIENFTLCPNLSKKLLFCSGVYKICPCKIIFLIPKKL